MANENVHKLLVGINQENFSFLIRRILITGIRCLVRFHFEGKRTDDFGCTQLSSVWSSHQQVRPW